MKHPFAGLMHVPAFGPVEMKKGFNLARIECICGIAWGEKGVIGTMSLEAGIGLSVEVRDALPGATVARSTPGETMGKAETFAASSLRRLGGGRDHPLVEDTRKSTIPVPPTGADEAAKYMLRLIDRDAAQRLDDPTAKRHAMETSGLRMAWAGDEASAAAPDAKRCRGKREADDETKHVDDDDIKQDEAPAPTLPTKRAQR